MLFAIYARVAPGAAPLSDREKDSLNDHLEQPVMHIRLGGFLEDASGRKSGSLILIDVEDEAAARHFANSSPLFKSGNYSEVQVDAFAPEIGKL